jgi:hypothetical protein
LLMLSSTLISGVISDIGRSQVLLLVPIIIVLRNKRMSERRIR